MNKLINRPENVVEEMLQGLAVLNPGMARLPGHKVMVRADINKVRDQSLKRSSHTNYTDFPPKD